MRLKVLELFAGIGACSKALERLGIEHEIVDAVEIDKYAIKSFNAIHGTNFEPQDITTWDKDIKCDLIMHGSPCQDFSIAGKQAGGDEGSGTRSSLMYETLRIVEKTMPKYVIWENVKNLVSKKHRHNYVAYLNAMNNLGFKNYGMVLNAKNYGVPQNRERVFTVSIREREREYEFPRGIPLERRLKDMLETNVDEKYYLSPKQMASVMSSHYDQIRRIYDVNGLCPTISTMGGGQRQPKVVDRLRVRKLTPKECWRLMGFEDEDFDKASKVNSNTQLYKQAGNSIVVNVLEGILTNLLKGA